jgi:hypothetical protein
MATETEHAQVESLLGEARLALSHDRPDVAVTHLAHAVLVASDFDADVHERVRAVIEAGGGFAP